MSVQWCSTWTFKPKNMKYKYFLIIFLIYSPKIQQIDTNIQDRELLSDRNNFKREKKKKGKKT